MTEIKKEFENNWLVLLSPPELGWEYLPKTELEPIKIIDPDTGIEV